MASHETDHIWDWDAPSGGILIYGATAANIATPVVGGDTYIVIHRTTEGRATIVVHGAADNASAYDDITFFPYRIR